MASREYDKQTALNNLRLSSPFTRSELCRAYRRMALKCSPDKPGGSARAFRIIKESVDVLEQYAMDRQDHRSVGDLVTQREKDIGAHRVASSFAAMNAEYERAQQGRSRGYGDWLKQDIDEKARPPEKIKLSDLHTTFEAIKKNNPNTLSTFVVSEMNAHSSVAHSIHDDLSVFDGAWYADLQSALS